MKRLCVLRSARTVGYATTVRWLHGLVQYVHYICDVLYASSTRYVLLFFYFILFILFLFFYCKRLIKTNNMNLFSQVVHGVLLINRHYSYHRVGRHCKGKSVLKRTFLFTSSYTFLMRPSLRRLHSRNRSVCIVFSYANSLYPETMSVHWG